ncbi:MAG: hypothetical protein A3K83_06615, partial [Omnitrophica WOR_2 bacterium RBG_13_44_8b]
SVYAARKKMDFLVVTKDIGGQAAWSGDIENYTGYQFITGPELTKKFEEHLESYGINLKENEQVMEVKKTNNLISVVTDKGTYGAKAVIIASGKRTKELNVPGEKEFKNKGVTYCATCDGPLFSAKDVAVIGGGNSALDAVLQLIKIANHIYLINITRQLTGDPVMQEAVSASKKVTVLNDTRISAITGDKFVSGIKIKTGQKEEALAVGGVFVEIGLMPNSEFVQGVETNELKEIKVNTE